MSAVLLGPVYLRLGSATVLSNLGDRVRAAAFPLLAASLTASPVLATSSLSFAVWNVAARTLIQRRTPLEMLGRIGSINGTVITAASILGALVGGVVAQGRGLHAPFLLGVPLLAAAALGGWWAPRPPPP